MKRQSDYLVVTQSFVGKLGFLPEDPESETTDGLNNNNPAENHKTRETQRYVCV